MQVRMIPVEAVFLRFPRLVRDLSTKLGKQVDLELVGKDTELDRTVVDALGDPLVHLIRNSLDHGLEGPEERQKAGKPATGTLHLSARHAGGNVVIEVRDDGRGINPAKVAQKAVERGLITEEAAATVDSAKAVELLFHPGFSTADVATDISGRGVGMDAVRTSIRELGGEVLMTSELGEGTVGADPPAADAGHHGRAAGGGRRPAVRHPARPHRAHRPPGRPHGPLGGRQPHAGHARRRAPDRRRLASASAVRPGRRPSTPSSCAAPPARWPSPSAPSSASASWSPGPSRPRSPRTPPFRAPPSCPTARSRSSSTAMRVETAAPALATA